MYIDPNTASKRSFIITSKELDQKVKNKILSALHEQIKEDILSIDSNALAEFVDPDDFERFCAEKANEAIDRWYEEAVFIYKI